MLGGTWVSGWMLDSEGEEDTSTGCRGEIEAVTSDGVGSNSSSKDAMGAEKVFVDRAGFEEDVAAFVLCFLGIVSESRPK